jgi:hypothetical protein
MPLGFWGKDCAQNPTMGKKRDNSSGGKPRAGRPANSTNDPGLLAKLAKKDKKVVALESNSTQLSLHHHRYVRVHGPNGVSLHQMQPPIDSSIHSFAARVCYTAPVLHTLHYT